MAETVAEMPIGPIPTKKTRNNRKALKEKNSSAKEANILSGKVSEPSPIPVPPADNPEKENHESLSQPRSSPKKGKAASKKQSKKQPQSFENDLLEMQEKLQQLRLEKDKAEELLKAKDEMLKHKEEELENRDRQHENLQMELKKLQKLKEFKPTVTFPIIGQSLGDKEKDKKENKKKKACPEKKKPSPPYILWCKDNWNEAKKENPEAEFKEISNILGAKWKNVTAEEKKPYEEKYQAEKEVYLQVIAKEKRESEAMKLLDEEHKQKTAMELLEQYLHFKQEAEKETKKKKDKDPLKPKHPMSSFFLFTNDRRAALLAEKKNVLEVARITGEEWKNMTEEQKGPYEEMAKKNKEKYLQEMEAYKQKKDEEAANLRKEEEEHMKLQKHEAFQLLKKKEKTENIIKKTKEIQQKKKQQQKEDKKSDPNKPKRPASSYLLFSKDARKNLLEERPGINNSTLNALISVKWKELNEVERKTWNDKAAEAMEAYKKEMEDYNKSAAATLDQNPSK